MTKANLHGFGIGEFGKAAIKLGQRRYQQYEDARWRILFKGEDIANFINATVNLPLKNANSRKWNDNVRYVKFTITF